MKNYQNIQSSQLEKDYKKIWEYINIYTYFSVYSTHLALADSFWNLWPPLTFLLQWSLIFKISRIRLLICFHVISWWHLFLFFTYSTTEGSLSYVRICKCSLFKFAAFPSNFRLMMPWSLTNGNNPLFKAEWSLLIFLAPLNSILNLLFFLVNKFPLHWSFCFWLWFYDNRNRPFYLDKLNKSY